MGALEMGVAPKRFIRAIYLKLEKRIEDYPTCNCFGGGADADAFIDGYSGAGRNGSSR